MKTAAPRPLQCRIFFFRAFAAVTTMLITVLMVSVAGHASTPHPLLPLASFLTDVPSSLFAEGDLPTSPTRRRPQRACWVWKPSAWQHHAAEVFKLLEQSKCQVVYISVPHNIKKSLNLNRQWRNSSRLCTCNSLLF